MRPCSERKISIGVKSASSLSGDGILDLGVLDVGFCVFAVSSAAMKVIVVIQRRESKYIVPLDFS
jgi:hypothetical protein